MATWMTDAACRDEDTELFFPIGGSEEFAAQIEDAKAVCQACPVRADCLLDALDRPHKYGIWGGLTETERANLRRQRQRRASANRARETA